MDPITAEAKYTKTDIETAIHEGIRLDRESVLLLLANKFKDATGPVPYKEFVDAVRALPIIASVDDVPAEPSIILP